MSSLLDQSALTDLAERLVAAARRAGADAADALALRSVSLAVEVREGAVEESERSEGDDVGLRVAAVGPAGVGCGAGAGAVGACGGRGWGIAAVRFELVGMVAAAGWGV